MFQTVVLLCFNGRGAEPVSFADIKAATRVEPEELKVGAAVQ